MQVEEELAEQVRNAVMWLHNVDAHTTISAIAEVGLRSQLARLRDVHRAGEPFPLGPAKSPPDGLHDCEPPVTPCAAPSRCLRRISARARIRRATRQRSRR